jgi:hypothetical protein
VTQRALAAIALGVLAYAAPPAIARAQQSGCEVGGTLEGIDVTVRRERGIRRVRLAAPTAVWVTPLRSGISALRSDDGEIAGTTRATLTYAIARATSLGEGTLELASGMVVERAVPSTEGGWLEVDIALGDGVWLRRAPVACDALVVVQGGDAPALEPLPIDALGGPAWRARTRRLYVRHREDGLDALRLEVAPDARARFVEITRHVAWVRVGLDTAGGARVRGWVRDEALIR